MKGSIKKALDEYESRCCLAIS